jgi:hypothetical protein
MIYGKMGALLGQDEMSQRNKMSQFTWKTEAPLHQDKISQAGVSHI